MKRAIKIGVLLVLTAVVVSLGVVLAQRPGQAPQPVASEAVRDELPKSVAVPAPNVLSPANSASPASSGQSSERPAYSAGMQPYPRLPPSVGTKWEELPSPPMFIYGATQGKQEGSKWGMMSMSSHGVAADPEVQKLHQEIQKAAGEEQSLLTQYAAAANEQERGRFKESLAKVLDRQFDLQQQMRKRELEPIEARVKRLRELIDKRSQARKTIVEKRLDQVLRDAEGMGWTPPSEPAATFFAPGAPGSVMATPGISAKTGGAAAYRSAGDKTSAGRDERSAAAPVAVAPLLAEFSPSSEDGSVLTDPASGQIEISLGASKGISRGQRLAVYRNAPAGPTYLARVVVVEAKPDRAICQISPEYQKGPIKKGDRLATTQIVVPTADATKHTQVKVFHFVNGDASSYAEIVSVLPSVSEKKVQLSVDKRTNSLVAAGPPEELRVIEALLARLDARQPPKSDAEADQKSKQP